MTDSDRNPFVSTSSFLTQQGNKSGVRSRFEQWMVLVVVSAAGVAAGSWISAIVAGCYFTGESDFMKDAIGAFLMSPFSMSLGIFPTMKFYGLHGWLVFPGIVCALFGTIHYLRNRTAIPLFFVFVGYVLWAHNNLLAWLALMSV